MYFFKTAVMPTIIAIAVSILALYSVLKSSCDEAELSRLLDPEQKIEVIVTRGDCGDTSSYSTHVYLVPAKEHIHERNLVATMDEVEGLGVSWTDAHNLLIQYDKARVHETKDHWQFQKFELMPRNVSIKITQKAPK